MSTSVQEFTRGQTAAANTLEVPAFLKDVKVEDASKAESQRRLFRCGIKPELGYQVNIQVAGITFATGTFRWEGSGETAKQREFSCAYQRVTDEDIEKLKSFLPFQYLRITRRPAAQGQTPLVTGVEHVDASDSGGLNGDGTVRPPKRRPSMLQGDEEPLVNYLIFEPVSESVLPQDGKVLSKEEQALRRAEAVANENEDMLHPESTGNGKSQRNRVRLELSTGNQKRKPEAGLLDG